MQPLPAFRKRFEFADTPADWRPVRATLDWSGKPLLLMVEGKGDSPSFREDPEAWSRWYRTPPKAHHVIYWVGHQGKGNQLLFPKSGHVPKQSDRTVECRHRLGGLLKYYGRAA